MFEFQPGFNLLVGENGAGKTTILRSLLAALGSAQQTGRRPKLADEDIRLHSRHAEVQAEWRTSAGQRTATNFRKKLWKRSHRSPRGDNYPLVLVYASNEATCGSMKSRRLRRSGEDEEREMRYREEFLYEREMEGMRRPTELTSRRFGNSRSVRQFVGKMLTSFSPKFYDFHWRFEPYDCVLRPPEGKASALFAGLQERARAVVMRDFQEGSLRGGRKSPYQWPDQNTFIIDKTSHEPSFRPEQTPNLRRIWDALKANPEERNFLEDCSVEVRLTPRIMIRYSSGFLQLSQLSDGEQRLFSLFVDIARQLSIRNEHNEIGGGEAIVLIDEIDVHLHPKWQRKIVPALEDLFIQCQFIATTHSPFVIQAVDRQKITPIDTQPSLSLFESGNSIEDIAETIQGVDIPQRSRRAAELSQAAQHYFRLLSKTNDTSLDQLYDAELAYRKASEPFTTEPAVHALLKIQLLETKNR